MTPRTFARIPTDFVPIDGTVRVAQNFVSGLKLNLIDFGCRIQTSLGCERQPRTDQKSTLRSKWKLLRSELDEVNSANRPS
jgi:hypothetical protein